MRAIAPSARTYTGHGNHHNSQRDAPGGGRPTLGGSNVDMSEQSRSLTLTVEQAGRLLGISRGLAYELVRRGEIPSIRLGKRILIPAQAIDDLLTGATRADRHMDSADLSSPPRSR